MEKDLNSIQKESIKKWLEEILGGEHGNITTECAETITQCLGMLAMIDYHNSHGK